MNRRALACLVVAALLWRSTLAWLTPIPSEDGVNYLWMAERFASLDWRAPLSEVFPPLLPLLIAAPLRGLHALGLEVSTFAVAQLVLALLGALTVWPIVRLCTLWHDARAAAWLGALLTTCPGLAARYCGEVYTEPAFGLCIALAALAGARGQFVRSGLAAGAAFWLRGEALALPVMLAVSAAHGQRLRAWLGAGLALTAALGLALWRAAAGQPFTLLPKLEFNWHKAAVAQGQFGSAVVDLPPAWLEAFLLVGVAALPGFYLARNQPGARAMHRTLLVAILAIVAFAVRRRFLVAWQPLIVPFAVIALLHLPSRVRMLVVAIAMGLGITVGLRTTDLNRLAERDVGAFLAPLTSAEHELVTDLTRVRYFAGLRPLPPRHLSVDELVAACEQREARYLVLGSNRTHAAEVRARCPEFTPLVLPADLSRRNTARGILVLAR